MQPPTLLQSSRAVFCTAQRYQQHFEIVMSAPLTYPVTFVQTGLDSTATGTVVTVNGTSKGYVDLPFTVLVENGSLLTYSYSNVSSSTNGTRFILTGVVGPSSPMKVTGAITVTGDYAVQAALLAIPFWVILILLVGLGLLGLLGAIVLLFFLEFLRRRRRKKSPRHSYLIISHPHI